MTLNSRQLYPIGYLPTGSEEQLGVVKPQAGLEVTPEGILTVAPATTTTIGGVIVGDGLSVSEEGVISAQPTQPSSSPLSRAFVEIVTEDLASGEQGLLSGEIAQDFILQKIEASSECRVRFYSNESDQSDDIARPIGTEPVGDHGVLHEIVLPAAQLVKRLTPPQVISTFPGSDFVPITVTNTAGENKILEIGLDIVKLTLKADPGTAPIGDVDDNVLLFLPGIVSPIQDFSNVPKALTIEDGAPSIATSEFKFPERGSSLLLPQSASISFPINDVDLTVTHTFWTMEAWVYLISDDIAQGGLIYGTYNNSSGGQSRRMIFTTKRFPSDSVGGNSSYSMPTGQWNYWKATRAETDFRLIVNGVQVIQRSYSPQVTLSGKNWIGRSVGDNNLNGWQLNGYLQDFIITEGVADNSLTVPTAPKFT